MELALVLIMTTHLLITAFITIFFTSEVVSNAIMMVTRNTFMKMSCSEPHRLAGIRAHTNMVSLTTATIIGWCKESRLTKRSIPLQSFGSATQRTFPISYQITT